jgi:hypothetical protein
MTGPPLSSRSSSRRRRCTYHKHQLATIEAAPGVELAIAQQLRLASILAVIAQLATHDAVAFLQAPDEFAGSRLPGGGGFTFGV